MELRRFFIPIAEARTLHTFSVANVINVLQLAVL
jgi:hypothetical protein